MQTTKELQEIGLRYIKERPEDAAIHGFDKELFKSWCIENGLTYEQSSFNPAMNTLINRGVLKHIAGTRGWALTDYSPETHDFLSLNAKGRKDTLKGMLTEVQWARIAEGVKLNQESESFTLALRQKLFPTGTADGFCSRNAPTSISQDSHINDKSLTNLWGFGEWNNSANVINEEVRINLLRIRGHIESVVQYPNIVYKVNPKGSDIPTEILAKDGKAMILPEDNLQTYRKMFEVRQLLTSTLDSLPGLRDLLESMRAAELEAKEEM
jgi:hypothetical protein